MAGVYNPSIREAEESPRSIHAHVGTLTQLLKAASDRVRGTQVVQVLVSCPVLIDKH